MKYTLLCLAALIGLSGQVERADAFIVVDANWWSNQASFSHVVDPPGPNGPQRVRLQGGYHTGYIEGTVLLPSNETWRIDMSVTTDSQFNLPTEFVKVHIDNVLVQTYFNSPLGTVYNFQHVFAGNQFAYRFDFSSPNTNEGSHLVVGRGTVTSEVPEPSPWPVLCGVLAGCGIMDIRRRKRAARRGTSLPPAPTTVI